MVNPWITNSLLDSCAFDPKYSPEHEAALELHNYWHQHSLLLIIAHSTKKELEHPNTPPWVKKEAATRIYTIPTGNNPEQLKIKHKILNILTGSGNPQNYVQDAEHIFEAHNYGSYFITTDGHILKKARELSKILNVVILLPSQFLKLVKENEA